MSSPPGKKGRWEASEEETQLASDSLLALLQDQVGFSFQTDLDSGPGGSSGIIAHSVPFSGLSSTPGIDPWRDSERRRGPATVKCTGESYL